MAQAQLDQLLNDVVNRAQGNLEAILIFDLDDNLPRYSNSQLEERNPQLYQALFGEGDDVGEAIKGFDALSTIQEALNQFGKKTQSGNLEYSIFKLNSRTMIVAVMEELNVPLAICFMSSKKTKIGNVLGEYKEQIDKIKEALRTM